MPIKSRLNLKDFRSILIAVLATLVLAGCAAFPLGRESETAPAQAPAPAGPAGGLSREIPSTRMIPATFADVAQVASPAVVNISAIRTMRSGTDRKQSGPGDFFDDLFRWFSGENAGPSKRQERSLGSGFLVNANGLILTNDHVVANAEQIVVRMLDEREYQARVLGRDPKTDLALIKIDAGDRMPYLTLGDSDRIRIGDWVLAIGNPFGLDHTVTSGIISGRARAIGAGPYDSFLQTDASINPGNSGGPLLNLGGEVIGIATAILAQGQGIGFAIPANMARGVIRQLESQGSVERGWLGINYQTVTPEVARSQGLSRNFGVLVAEVAPGGPAAEAGMTRGDQIVSLDGRQVSESTPFHHLVAEMPVGRIVPVVVIRNGQERKMLVKIARQPD